MTRKVSFLAVVALLMGAAAWGYPAPPDNVEARAARAAGWIMVDEQTGEMARYDPSCKNPRVVQAIVATSRGRLDTDDEVLKDHGIRISKLTGRVKDLRENDEVSEGKDGVQQTVFITVEPSAAPAAGDAPGKVPAGGTPAEAPPAPAQQPPAPPAQQQYIPPTGGGNPGASAPNPPKEGNDMGMAAVALIVGAILLAAVIIAAPEVWRAITAQMVAATNSLNQRLGQVGNTPHATGGPLMAGLGQAAMVFAGSRVAVTTPDGGSFAAVFSPDTINVADRQQLAATLAAGGGGGGGAATNQAAQAIQAVAQASLVRAGIATPTQAQIAYLAGVLTTAGTNLADNAAIDAITTAEQAAGRI